MGEGYFVLILKIRLKSSVKLGGVFSGLPQIDFTTGIECLYLNPQYVANKMVIVFNIPMML